MSQLSCVVVWAIGAALLAGPLAAALPTPVTTAQIVGASDPGWGGPVRLSGNGSWAGSPDVAADFYGNAIAVWYQPDDISTRASIWTSRFIPGGGWTSASQLMADQEGAFLPHVAMAPWGVAIAVWAGNRSVWASEFVPEFPGSHYVGWSGPFATRGGGGFVGRAQVGFVGSGRALVVWDDYDESRCYSDVWANWYVIGSGWDAPTRISPLVTGTTCPYVGGATEPQIATSPTGKAIVVWQTLERGRSRSLWATSFDPARGWAIPTVTDEGGCRSSVGLAVSPSGYAFVTWVEGVRNGVQSCGGGPSDSIYAAVFHPDTGWDKAVRGPDGGQPHIAADSEGGATVVWCDRGTPHWSCGGVWMSRFVAGTGWSHSTLVADDYGFDPPKVAVDSFGNTLVIWSHVPVVTDSNGTRSTLRGANLEASRLVTGLGWQPPVAISLAFGEDEDFAIDAAGNAIVVWAGRAELDGNASLGIWSNRFVPRPGSSLLSAQPVAGDSFLVSGAFVLAASALALTLALAFSRYSRTKPRAQHAPFRLASSAEGQRTRMRRWTGLKRTARAITGGESAPRPSPRAWPKVNGPLRLTVRERILLHLLEFSRYADAVEVPLEITQPGISRGAAVDLRHIAQYVRPMVKEGLVRERSGHVNGLVKKHKVYVLADGGRHVAAGVRDRVRSAAIRVRDDLGVHEATVADAVAKRRGRPLLEIVRESIEAGVMDLRS